MGISDSNLQKKGCVIPPKNGHICAVYKLVVNNEFRQKHFYVVKNSTPVWHLSSQDNNELRS